MQSARNDGSSNPLARQLLWLVDFGLVGVIFIAPLFLGGRGPIGKLVFIAFSSLVAIAWVSRQLVLKESSWRRSGVEWLLLGGLLLVLLQLLPLPPSLLSSLSPNIENFLPLWSSGSRTSVHLGNWSTTSLAPEATGAALCVYIGYALLFLITVQRIESTSDVERILRWIALGVIAMATIGILQFLICNDKFLWIYAHYSRHTNDAVKGTFQNQNHFAHFLALGIGPIIWWLWKASTGSYGESSSRLSWNVWGRKRGQRSQVTELALAVGLGIVAFAGLLTFSRGGVIAVAGAAAVCIGLCYSKSLLGKRAVVALAALVVAMGGALAIHGYEPLAKRLSTLRDASSLEELSRGRNALWSAILDGAPEFALTGTGIGSHREAHRMFMEDYFDVEFSHGESGYLPLLLEAGIPGLALVLVGIGFCGYWCVRVLRQRTDPHGKVAANSATARTRRVACMSAIFPGLLASVLHSTGDFVWYIGACMSVTILLIGCACRLWQLEKSAETTASRLDSRLRTADRGIIVRSFGFLGPGTANLSQPARIGTALIVVLVAATVAIDRVPAALAAPHWYEYLKVTLASDPTQGFDSEVEAERLYKMHQSLRDYLEMNPVDPRANIRMASVCLRKFEFEQRDAINPMSLSQIRDAALASDFPSRQAQDAWIAVAVGENRKLLDLALKYCHQGLSRCPLYGEGYVYLSELSFLEGPNEAAKREYVAQAATVLPHSGVVRFALGKESILDGDHDTAMEHWRVAFKNDPRVRRQLVELLVPQVPAEFFLQQFDSPTDGLGMLYRKYKQLGRMEDAATVASNYVTALIREAQRATPTEAAPLWHKAQSVYTDYQDHAMALRCQQKAVELAPNNFSQHRTLANLLIRNERFSEAVAELKWCLRRSPDDNRLLEQLAMAKRMAIRPPSSASILASPSTIRKR